MAYYDESYIDRIRAIKELQSKRFLPLSIIKEMMEANNFSLSVEQRQLLKEMEKPLFEDWIFNSNQDPLDKKSLSEHTGLSSEDIEALERIGMISLDQDGLFDKECIQIAEILAELRKIGLTEERDFHVEHLQIHQDLIEFMARKEVEIFTKRIDPGDLSPKEVISLAQEAVDILKLLDARFKCVLDTLFVSADDFNHWLSTSTWCCSSVHQHLVLQLPHLFIQPSHLPQVVVRAALDDPPRP